MAASVSHDRYVRFHSVVDPPPQAGQNMDNRGKTLEKVYAVGSPTVVVWDQEGSGSGVIMSAREREDEDMWETMKQVEEDEDNGRRRKNVKSA